MKTTAANTMETASRYLIRGLCSPTCIYTSTTILINRDCSRLCNLVATNFLDFWTGKTCEALNVLREVTNYGHGDKVSSQAN